MTAVDWILVVGMTIAFFVPSPPAGGLGWTPGLGWILVKGVSLRIYQVTIWFRGRHERRMDAIAKCGSTESTWHTD